MIRIAPEAPPEAIEEKKRAREVIISNITTFFIAVAVIRLGKFYVSLIIFMIRILFLIVHVTFVVPHAIKLLNE